MDTAQTPRQILYREGSAKLYRFADQRSTAAPAHAPPILLVPSLINRWYVLDLFPGSSLVEALVGIGLDTFCLDWGVPGDEDRFLDWDAVVSRLSRAVRMVQRKTGAARIALVGYCMGGTLAGI